MSKTDATSTVTIALDKPMKRWLKKYAADRDISMGHVIKHELKKLQARKK